MAVQIYLCVNGGGSKRASLIQEFYKNGLQNTETKFSYPDIKPHTMASLSELLQIELTVSDVMPLLLQTLNSMGSSLINMPLNATEQELFETRYVHV